MLKLLGQTIVEEYLFSYSIESGNELYACKI